jgi:hypothetical protein
LPADDTRACTFFEVAFVSGIRRWNSPFASSSSVETASLWRSRDFGVITTSGLRVRMRICRRIMWNILRRRGRRADLHVLQRAQLQETLKARRAVFRALAFVTVRQEQRQAAQAAPLGFAGGEELVDDDLGTVGEIAELAFPDVQRHRVGGRVAVLERHHRLLAEQRVDDGHVFRAAGRRVLQQFAQRQVVIVRGLVVQHRVAMEERAAAAVLADQAQAIALVHQRGVGQVLGEAPVAGLFAGRHLAAVLVDLGHARVQLDRRPGWR